MKLFNYSLLFLFGTYVHFLCISIFRDYEVMQCWLYSVSNKLLKDSVQKNSYINEQQKIFPVIYK